MKMHSEGEIHRSFKVGSWDFRPMLKELKAPDGRTVKLEDKISLLLETLCSRDGAVVSKEELIDAVWDGREVSEQTIPVAISKLRKTLGDNSASPTMLETVPRHGYRMMREMASASAMSGAGTPNNNFMRMAIAVSLVIVVALAWMVFDKGANIGTSPALAAKPGIILTINDVRPVSKADGQIDRAIALSELASFYLSQMPDVLVIRHWWNLDAPDPTGGIYTRYGAETPVYALKSTLLEENGEAAVALILSNPKTEEILWSGLHFVGRGTGD
ncbi:MAG: winged helix-turn-helix domain-containing protein, partial [Kordiimonadaceae bacterium]|nr:winged helix-turn-helix domain-containing protein [Kordiimonadaceae bacterium]